MRSKSWPRNSIRARMTAGFALFIGLLMVAMCSVYFFYTRLASQRDADARLASTFATLQKEFGSGRYSLEKPNAFLDEEGDDLRAANAALVILDEQNRVVAQSQKDTPPWPPRDDAWRIATFTAGNRRAVIGVPWHQTEEALREHTTLALCLSALIVAFSSLGAWVLVGRTLAPINDLARQAKAVSAESLTIRLEASSPDAEITSLVETLDDLLTRLSETAAIRGRFYAAESHELRTPLQALTGRLEVARSRARTIIGHETALDEARSQAEQLTSLVQDLLLLNQLDANTMRPAGVLLDVADICVSEMEPLQALAEERGLAIELSLPDVCEVIAPWNHVTMLLRNLLENAVKYALPATRVRIQLTETTLSITNCSEPVSDIELHQYFNPFFRTDASRNSETGGNGFGLASCRAIADTNGWTLTLQPFDGGICATVQF
jgi:signal transduction histidine kinase